MKKIDHYPKSLKKAIRYIKQDAPIGQLNEIKKLIDNAIKVRNINLLNKKGGKA